MTGNMRVSRSELFSELETLFEQLSSSNPAGPCVAVVSAPPMAGKSQAIADFLQRQIDGFTGSKSPPQPFWQPLPQPDTSNGSLILSQAYPAPLNAEDRRESPATPPFYWFATGAFSEPGSRQSDGAGSRNPWFTLLEQLGDDRIVATQGHAKRIIDKLRRITKEDLQKIALTAVVETSEFLDRSGLHINNELSAVLDGLSKGAETFQGLSEIGAQAQLKKIKGEIARVSGVSVFDTLSDYAAARGGRPSLLIVEDIDAIDPLFHSSMLKGLEQYHSPRLLVIVTGKEGSAGLKRFCGMLEDFPAINSKARRFALSEPDREELWALMRKEFKGGLQKELFAFLYDRVGGGSPAMMRYVLQALSGLHGCRQFLIRGSGSYRSRESLETIQAYFEEIGAAGGQQLQQLVGQIALQGLQGLSPLHRKLLAAGAFLGEEFPVTYLARVCQLMDGGDITGQLASLQSLESRTPLVRKLDESVLGFSSAFARGAVLSDQHALPVQDRLKFLSAYTGFLFDRTVEHESRGTDRDAEAAKIVLSIADGAQTLDTAILSESAPAENTEASDERQAALFLYLPQIAAESFGPENQAISGKDINRRANELLEAAVRHWSGGEFGPEDHSAAAGHLRFLRSALARHDSEGRYARAQSLAAISVLSKWLNVRTRSRDEIRKRAQMAADSVTAVKAAQAESRGDEYWALYLRRLELMLLQAEAKILDSAADGKTAGQEISANDRYDRRTAPLLEMIGSIDAAAAPVFSTDQELAKLVAQDLDKESLDRKIAEILSRSKAAAAAGHSPDGKEMPKEVQSKAGFLRIRALERFVRLAQRGSLPKEQGRLELLEQHRSALQGDLKKLADLPPGPETRPVRVWAARKLGLNFLSGEFEAMETEAARLGQAYEYLNIAYSSEKSLKSGAELLRAVEAYGGVLGSAQGLSDLRRQLEAMADQFAGDPVAGALLTGIFALDRRLQEKMSGAGLSVPASLWTRAAEAGRQEEWLQAILASLPRLQQYDRRRALAELLTAKELSEVPVVERIAEAAKSQGLLARETLADAVEAVSGQIGDALKGNAVPDSRMLSVIAEIDTLDALIGHDAVRPRLAVALLRERLTAKATVAAIRSGTSLPELRAALDNQMEFTKSAQSLAEGLNDQDALAALLDRTLAIAQALFDRAMQAETPHGKFAFRKLARIWFDWLEQKQQFSINLAQKQLVWERRAEFHNDHGNRFVAAGLQNQIARSRRFERIGDVAGGLHYLAAEAQLNPKAYKPGRAQRYLLEAVFLGEINHAARPEDERSPEMAVRLWVMRSELAHLLWQRLRHNQPAQTRSSIPFNPPKAALDAFVFSRRGAEGLVSDTLDFWGSEAPASLTAGTKLAAQIIRVEPLGLVLRDAAGREVLMPVQYLPITCFNGFERLSSEAPEIGMAAALSNAGLPGRMMCVILGPQARGSFGEQTGYQGDLPIVSARGPRFVQGVIECFTPGLPLRRGEGRPSFIIGGSNSAAAVFVRQGDERMYRRNNGLLRAQVCGELILLPRLTFVPIAALHKSRELDPDAVLAQELEAFVGVYDSSLTVSGLKKDRSEAVLSLSIGAAVQPRKERTTRSMLRKAFPGIGVFRFEGGALEHEAFENAMEDSEDTSDQQQDVPEAADGTETAGGAE